MAMSMPTRARVPTAVDGFSHGPPKHVAWGAIVRIASDGCTPEYRNFDAALIWGFCSFFASEGRCRRLPGAAMMRDVQQGAPPAGMHCFAWTYRRRDGSVVTASETVRFRGDRSEVRRVRPQCDA